MKDTWERATSIKLGRSQCFVLTACKIIFNMLISFSHEIDADVIQPDLHPAFFGSTAVRVPPFIYRVYS